MRSNVSCGALGALLFCVGGLGAQEPKREGLPAEFLGERARAFLEALASGDAKNVLPFQPREMREGMGEEERRAFAAGLKHAGALLASPAGSFQRAALERCPRIDGLPADAQRVVASWELEISSEHELRPEERKGEEREPRPPVRKEVLLHGVRLRFGAEREAQAQGPATWPVAEFEVELESVQPTTGRVIPEFDLAPVTLTGSMGELIFGTPPDEVIARASRDFIPRVLALPALDADPASAAGPLIEGLRRAIAAKDGPAFLEGVHLEAGVEGTDAKALVEALSAFVGLDDRLRAWVRPGALPRTATRGSVEVATPAGSYLVEWSKKKGRWALDDLAFEPAEGSASPAFHLRELLSR
ncbi:MAG: hypothetical protein IPN34_05080 [Planctomycetes bacterium]|nr:hypothetical protein [Planctomycetota bacterium]